MRFKYPAIKCVFHAWGSEGYYAIRFGIGIGCFIAIAISVSVPIVATVVRIADRGPT